MLSGKNQKKKKPTAGVKGGCGGLPRQKCFAHSTFLDAVMSAHFPPSNSATSAPSASRKHGWRHTSPEPKDTSCVGGVCACRPCLSKLSSSCTPTRRLNIGKPARRLVHRSRGSRNSEPCVTVGRVPFTTVIASETSVPCWRSPMWTSQARAEGLTLLEADNKTGYYGVHHNQSISKPYQAREKRGDPDADPEPNPDPDPDPDPDPNPSPNPDQVC